MKIIRADHAGFCFGVKRAIEKIEKTLESGTKLYAIGEPIHNPQEIERLCRLGLIVAKSPDDVPDGACAFIRAHGVPPEVTSRLREKGVSISDGTCPFVKIVQSRARQLSREGYHVLLLGEEKHPEVRGILGHVEGKYSVVSSEKEVSVSTILNGSDIIAKLGLVSQTTQEESTFLAVKEAAKKIAGELKVYNTICSATQERQEAVRQLAASADGMVVIGGKNSANTGRLCSIAEDAGCPVQWIELPEELDAGWFAGKEVIGIAAGASTPDWLIEQVEEAIARID